jgi:hypothetical protein
VASQVLANGSGMYTIQAVGVKAGGNYLLRVGPATASGSAAVGNYALDAKFGTSAAQLTTLLNGSITGAAVTGASNSTRLYVAESQLFHFVLAASTADGSAAPGQRVQMTVLNQLGGVVFALTAAAGDAVSGPALFLTPGAYTIRFSVSSTPGTVASALTFTLLGEVISDPIGPVIADPTLDPALNPNDPGFFAFPIADTPAFGSDPALTPTDVPANPDPSTFVDTTNVSLSAGDLLTDPSTVVDTISDPGNIVTDTPYWLDVYDPTVLA